VILGDQSALAANPALHSQPAYPVGTDLYPLGEFAGRLEARDVL
jgi:hypothetical protein